ncbi:conserved hypothetical protein [Anaeromyxobacter sp. K]|uniref:hypothetical protein n=1 Tax=Anaeromyxobacter sp. (strain K) TaxID=447217 RepID=UPI00015F9D32|nr:hypothetical protein [Anaeromyxobacter sp. K]ACG71537.1 conserved hypothetical protein [Anaeromyxobacter sp. K]
MTKFAWSVLALALLGAPAAARAGGLLELSVGSGARIDPSPTERIPTNVMLTAGYGFADMLKLELGAVANLGDVEDSKFDIDLRPMLVVSPPLFPVYLRGIMTVNSLVEEPVKIGYGGALGVRLGVLGLGAFVEAGVLARIVEVPDAAGVTHDKTFTIVEGRVGGYWD